MAMKRLIALLALCSASIALAHHSISAIEITKPLWLQGTVTQYRPAHPHALTTLRVTTGNGTLEEWLIDGPTLARLERMGAGGDVLVVGDVIRVCGFAFKQHSSRKVLHGHVIVMPEGNMRLWGPYGKLDHCIRAEDTASIWIKFLRADALALASWCRRPSPQAPSHAASPATVAQINRGVSCP
jgi:Family of unknown function (DUF6152)